MRKTVLALLLLSAPVRADVGAVIDLHILPGLDAFTAATIALAQAAQSDCRPSNLVEGFHLAFDAWIPLSILRLGPTESLGPSIAFWPDERGFTPRALKGLIAAQDPIADDKAAFAEVSIAARGLFALEMLLFDPEFSAYGQNDYTCRLVQAVAADLASQTDLLQTSWTTEYAGLMRGAGDAGNVTYLDKDEAVGALYSQIHAALEFTSDKRLGLPLGSFDHPRPRLAEAWRSGRSLRNIELAVDGAQSMAQDLVGGTMPTTAAAADRIRRAASAIQDPSFQDLNDPKARFRAEALQQAVLAMRQAVQQEIGVALGIATDFNSQDGD